MPRFAPLVKVARCRQFGATVILHGDAFDEARAEAPRGADPFAPKEVAFYEPDAPQGHELSSSNDVTIDDRGICYLIDRQRGVDIIETSVM